MTSTKKTILTKDKIGLSELFKVKRMKPYIKPTKPHKHSGYHEIILLTTGEGFHTIELNAHNVTPPMVFTLKTEQIHHWEFTEKPEGYVLMFKPEFLQKFQITSADLPNIDECIQLDSSNISAFDYIFKNIIQELEDQKENYKSSISSHLNILLIALSRLSSKPTQTPSLSNSKFQLFNELVTQKFKTEKKVSQYANWLHITPKHLNDLCKKSVNKTASTIIQTCINTEAKRLLIYSDKNISEISQELGFDNSSHFAKFFKKQIGISPKLFRDNRFQ